DDRKMTWRLETSRQTYLEWDRQFGAALQNARRLAERPGLSPVDREWLLDRQAYNLHNLDRVDELIALFDRRLVPGESDAKNRLNLQKAKADYLGYHNRPEQTLAAYRAYRDAAKPGSDEWLEASSRLADQLRQSGQHRTALKVVTGCLAAVKWP